MDDEDFGHHLKAARVFGCLPAFLLASGIGSLIIVGSVMGDCEAGAGCHDHDGLLILTGLFWTILIATAIGLMSWLMAAILRAEMLSRIGAIGTNSALIAITLCIVWLFYGPAIELLSAIMAPSHK